MDSINPGVPGFMLFVTINDVVCDSKQSMAGEDEWKRKLAPEQYRVLRERETEQPFTGKYWDEHAKGMYRCAACGEEIFSSDAKFDSGTGWPSFKEPSNLKNIELHEDTSYGLPRTEVRCKKCGSHLGHVFDDGPGEKGGKRYCINSVCLELQKGEKKDFKQT